MDKDMINKKDSIKVLGSLGATIGASIATDLTITCVVSRIVRSMPMSVPLKIGTTIGTAVISGFVAGKVGSEVYDYVDSADEAFQILKDSINKFNGKEKYHEVSYEND